MPGPPIGGDAAGTVKTADVVDLLLQLFPQGFSKWTSVRFTSSNVYKLIAGVADSLKTYGFDLIDTFRQEMNPATSIQKLSDFETALGLTTTFAAVSGTNAQRQNGVIAKFRESGAFTVFNTRSILGAILGYADPSQVSVMETSRASLKTAHTYAGAAISIPASNSASGIVALGDGGTVSAAGVQLVVTVTHATAANLSFKLQSPSGGSVTWPAGTITGNVSGLAVYLYAKSFAGTGTQGTWTLTITNAGAGTGSATWTEFVEGIGPGMATGGAIFDWGVYADPTKTNSPDIASARQAIARIKHGHTVGNLIQSIAPYPDVDSGVHAAIPDEATPV